jgi:hypothetical protein
VDVWLELFHARVCDRIAFHPVRSWLACYGILRLESAGNWPVLVLEVANRSGATHGLDCNLFRHHYRLALAGERCTGGPLADLVNTLIVREV